MFLYATCAMALAFSQPQSQSAQTGNGQLGLTKGPATVKLGKVGQLQVPEGYAFIDGATYQAMLRRHGKEVSGQEMGLLQSPDDTFAVAFEFSNDGYVKDDEKAKLDSMADKLLDSYRRGAEEENKRSAEIGHQEVRIVGWEVRPKYDETTHNLEWGIKATVGGDPLMNYDTRLLGRKGVMRAILILDPAQFAAALPKFRELMAGYSFVAGETYAEFRSGDKIAKYGLTALVVGGAAVGAAKLGLLTGLLVFLKKGWKLVVVGFAAVATAIKKFFARITGRRNETIPRG
jgi:uncharacterized membrane-anchored protein